VSAGIVAVAHGTDSAGSLRAPASACGLVGLKPSRGRTTLAPDEGEHWGGLTQLGFLTRSVRDTASMLDVVAGPEPGDPSAAPFFARPLLESLGADPGRLRVGIRRIAPETGAEPHPEVAAALSQTAALLEVLGHDVVEDWPPAIDDIERVRHAAVVTGTGVAWDLVRLSVLLGRELGVDDVEPPTWGLAEIGFAARGVRYLEAVDFLHGYSRRVVSWWTAGMDLLVTPTMPTPPFALGMLAPTAAPPRGILAAIADALRYTAPFNATGQPAISLPIASSSSGLPIGIQLIAAPWREDLLVSVAAQLEVACPWGHRRPNGIRP
jgi:amidase